MHYEKHAPKAPSTSHQSTSSAVKGTQKSQQPPQTAFGKARTKGLFGNDPQMQKVIKHSADFRKNELKSLLERNLPLQQFLDKRQRIEDKKIGNKRASKAILDLEVKRDMQRNERDFIKKNAASIRATFFREPKVLD